MKRLALALAVVLLGAVAVIATAIAKNGNGDGRAFSARLTGYEEIIPASATAGEGGAVSTVGNGRFRARVKRDGSALKIDYRLRYEGLEGTDTLFAHIHFGQRHTIGGISAFLCDSDPSNNATLPDCTNTNGDITGTIEASEVGFQAVAQGIEAGNIAELIRAMRQGVAYVNVHTNKWPSGEIRGQIDHGRHHGRDDNRGKKDDD